MTMAAAIDNGTAVTGQWSKSGRIAHIDIVHDLASAEAVWRGLETEQGVNFEVSAWAGSDFKAFGLPEPGILLTGASWRRSKIRCH